MKSVDYRGSNKTIPHCAQSRDHAAGLEGERVETRSALCGSEHGFNDGGLTRADPRNVSYWESADQFDQLHEVRLCFYSRFLLSPILHAGDMPWY